jgi:thiamine monophosphate kinase
MIKEPFSDCMFTACALKTDQSSNPGMAVGVKVAALVGFMVDVGDGLGVDVEAVGVEIGMGWEVGAGAAHEASRIAIRITKQTRLFIPFPLPIKL